MMGGPLEVTLVKGEIRIWLDDYPITEVTTLQWAVSEEFQRQTYIITKPPKEGNVDSPKFLVLKADPLVHETTEKLNLLRVWCEGFLIGFELNPEHFH